MIQEEKQLLLNDLCARLPYGVKIEITWWTMSEGTCMDTTLKPDHIDQLLTYDDTEIRPYLRPMSSMTEEELNEFRAFHCLYDCHPEFYVEMCNLPNMINMFKWLKSHHFDYHGLIEKGIALEAPEDMYNF